MSLLESIKNKLSLAQKREADETLARFKGVTEFFADAIEAAKDNDVLVGILKAVPWEAFQIVGKAAVEAVPPLKFAYKLISKLTEITDPDELWYLACTLAYQRSVEQAVRALGLSAKLKVDASQLKKKMGQRSVDQGLDFKTFTFATAFEHPFKKESDEALKTFADGFDYGDDDYRKLVSRVHSRFVLNLKQILATSDRFANLRNLIELGASEYRIDRALELHAAYQVSKFEERPVFGREPFSLREIYVEQECGLLRWEEIRKSRSREAGPSPKALDPFVEKSGGRQPLLKTVLDLMADPELTEAIVIQGVAGSGKSTFTLRLCSELLELGFRPIRVQLRDLDLNRDLLDDLPRVITLYDPEKVKDPAASCVVSLGDDLFRDNPVLDSALPLGQARISPYVLILDAWDELSVGGSGNLHNRIERTLSQVRSHFLNRPHGKPPIRVILTGRPSVSVEESLFLRDRTPILTIRPLCPAHLRELVSKLMRVLTRPSEVFPQGREELNPQEFEQIHKTYEKNFARIEKSDRGSSETGPLGVMGLPLLAQVVVRLVALGSVKPEALMNDPTTLFRTLVDVTCKHRGQVAGNAPHLEGDYPYEGRKLRRLLWHTAAAISLSGKESISRLELKFRLEKLEWRGDLRKDLAALLGAKNKEHPLADLLVSYYFKAGHPEAGCEFAHKSFREYLFAEGIVEALNAHAGYAQDTRSDRVKFWMDFAEFDPRHHFSRTLGKLLSPVWLSPEVENHIRNLIKWEVSRDALDAGTPTTGLEGEPTDPITLDQWELVRDDLADLWEWWGEGVHLRPQIRLDDGDIKDRQRLYALELIEWSMPKDFPREGPLPPPPPRTVAVDSRLGAGLFLLCGVVHREIAKRRGYAQRYQEAIQSGSIQPGDHKRTEGNGTRSYQFSVNLGSDEVVWFAPSFKEYFPNYIARINAAGWRPLAPFPAGADLGGVWLAQADLRGANLRGADLFQAALIQADLFGATLLGANLRGADLRGADLRGANLREANLSEADLRGANLGEANLRGANLRGANLRLAILNRADLRGANLRGADLRGAILREANLSRANLRGANLSRANLGVADLSGANLSGADLRGADLRKARNLLQDQLARAKGDQDTKLPDGLVRPETWAQTAADDTPERVTNGEKESQAGSGADDREDQDKGVDDITFQADDQVMNSGDR